MAKTLSNRVMSEEKKPRKPRAKKAKVVPALSAEPESDCEALDAMSQTKIDNLIKQAVALYYTEETITAQKNKDIQHLSLITEEYLKTFMILGYDITGNKVVIMNAKTSHDRDALVEHLRSTFITTVQGD